MAVPLRLKVFKGEELIATREFERDMIKIGRLATAHLGIEDDKVSRIHSVLNVEGDGRLSIVDMGSVEGTYLNGKRINKGSVNFGDELRIGNTRIVVEKGGAEAPAAVEAPPSETSHSAITAVATLPPGAVVQSVSEAETLKKPLPPVPPPEAVAQNVVQNVAVPPPAPEAAPFAAAAPVVSAPADEEPVEEFGGVFEDGRHREFHLRDRAFNSYRFEKPAARRPRSASGSLGLQVRYYWGDQLLQVSQYESPRQVVVGTSKKSDLQVEAEQLPEGSFTLVSPAGGGFAVNLGPGMKGELDRDGKVSALKGGTHELRAPDFAWVELSKNLRAELSFAPMSRRVAVPLGESIDYKFVNLFLLLAMVGGAFIITANNFEEADVVADDLSMNRLVVAKFIMKEAEKPKKNALLEKLQADKNQQKNAGEMAEKRKGDEGKMGKKDAAETKTNRSAPKAIKIDAKELVKNSGLLKTLGGGGGGLSTIFGQGGLGGDIKGAVGNMFGTKVGDSGGFGGLGLKGTGVGGGGTGNTIGIGEIGTKGRGGGLGNYGLGVGNLGGKKGVDVGISDSDSVVQGSLDKELIRQVIRRNIGQIKYCYEKELQVKPKLAGKIAVRFVIAPNGDVASAKVAEGSTLTDASVGECVTVRVRSWKFPSPKGGGSVIVTYPFVFKQSGE